MAEAISVALTAIDLGTEAIIPGSENRQAVDHTADADTILSAWAAALQRTLSQIDSSQVKGIGFAIPGPFEYRNGISKMEHKFLSLKDCYIPDALNAKLEGAQPIAMRFLNDAASFAVGEAWLGAGKGFERVVVITLGTGFGSAFVDKGIPISKREDVPKEGCLWHLPHADGMADDYFSTRGLVNLYAKISGKQLPNAKAVADAIPTDPAAAKTFAQFGSDLAAFLGPWLTKFQADCLVIGGNIARAFDHFGPTFSAALMEVSPKTSIVLSTLGENAAIIGSARSFETDFWNQVKDNLPAI